MDEREIGESEIDAAPCFRKSCSKPATAADADPSTAATGCYRMPKP